MSLFVNKNAFAHTLRLEFERAKKCANPILHIDEIGLMEKISPPYIKMLTYLMKNFKVPIIAVIKYIEKDDFLDEIKSLDNAGLYMVTKRNRTKIEAEVFEEFTVIIKKTNQKTQILKKKRDAI